MKKYCAGIPFLLFVILSLSGCNTVGSKNASLSVIYFATAILSLLLLVGCCIMVQKNKIWFVLLFSSVLVVNTGYAFLSVSSSLEMALWANRLSYLGSVFLPFAMLMIILEVSGTAYPEWLHGALGILSAVVFLIAASQGILPVYYKEVSFAVINGASTLIKAYGPLHPVYLFYLLGYFAAMVTVIIRAHLNRTLDNTAHAVILAIAVFVNIGVWFIEQLTHIDFEMLSVSYIISELFLLGVHLVMNEYQKMRSIVKQVEQVQTYTAEENTATDIMLEKPLDAAAISPERIENFISGLSTLTATEKTIYDAYISRVTTKELLASMDIKESTLKFHNRNIYSKLGVSTRKELLELHKHIKSVKTKLAQTKQ